MTYLCAALPLLYMFPLDLMVKLAALIYSCRHVPSIAMATDGGLGRGGAPLRSALVSNRIVGCR